MAFAGPAISGDSVVWGTEYSDGSGAVKVEGRVVTRFERAKGGRVAYITMDARSGPDRLVLADLTGKIVKRLDRYGKRRWPEGELALTDRWAAWSVKRATYGEPTGPGNVFLKKL